MATKTTKNPTVKGKTGKVVDYAVSSDPKVTAINKARAQNKADGVDVYSGAGAKGQIGGGSSTGVQYEPGSEGFGPDGKGVPIRNEEQQNPYGYYGTKENQFPNTPQNPSAPSGYDSIIPDGMYKGLTAAQAEARKKEQAGQVSSLTSFGFNPQTVSGAKKTLEGFNLKLNDINSDPWLSKGSKKDKVAGLYESTANEYARLFNSPQEFESLLASDADFAASVDAYKRAGGDVNSIRARIGGQAPVPAVSPNNDRFAAVQDLMRQGVRDPGDMLNFLNYDDAGNKIGDFTAPEVESLMSGKNNQTTAEYLAGISTKAPEGYSPAEKDAFQSLIPEREAAQQEIIRQHSIPQQYKDIYFGTPEQVGLLEEKRIQAEEKKKILQKQEKSDERNLRARANYVIESNNADMEIEDAQIEENRLAARNYATGMLAKLGALNTTGAAPAKLAALEQKYQQQKQVLRTTTRFANQKIELDLKEKVDDIQTKLDDDVLKVSTDFTKDKEDVLKETQKLEQAAGDKIYSITDKAAGELRTTKEKFVKEAKTLAEKNAKEAAKAAAKYSPASILAQTKKQKAAALTTDVEDAVSQLRDIVKTQNFYGVSQSDYDEFETYFLKTYGSAGVAKLKTAMNALGLKVDAVGDDKGGI